VQFRQISFVLIGIPAVHCAGRVKKIGGNGSKHWRNSGRSFQCLEKTDRAAAGFDLFFVICSNG
jgi:hypothetical protein